MMIRSLGWMAGGFFLFALGSCGRNADFVHYVAPQPPRTVKTPHKLKEMVGYNKVDILWVIDNSGSMRPHQQAVSNNAHTFMDKFVKKTVLDWKMGLISTDERQQPFIGFTPSTLLQRGTKTPVDDFRTAVGRLTTGGADIEKMYEPVMKQFGQYTDFLRRDAILAFIVVTDEPEQSRMTTQQFIDEMVKLKGGDRKKVVAYGAIAAKDLNCNNGFMNYKASKYEELIVGLKGKVYGICGPGFGDKLADLGDDLVQKLENPRLVLKERPAIGSIRVVFNGKDLPGGPKERGGFWVYDFDLNSLVFHDLDFAKGDNEEVGVVYDKAYVE